MNQVHIVAMTRIGLVDGELRLDARGPIREHDHAGGEQQGLFDVMGHQQG